MSVLVISYQRPDYLAKCLASLRQQRRLPDEVVIVAHHRDEASHRVLAQEREDWPDQVRFVSLQTEKANIVVSENLGLTEVTGDIVCFIDDDGIALPDWLERIEVHYRGNPLLGGVGGPVIPYVDGQPVLEMDTAPWCISWWGGRSGTTTSLLPDVAEVDYLRGANMSFRRSLFDRFDERLIGYADRFEDDVCLQIRNQGYKLLYDPGVQVYHHEARREFDPFPPNSGARYYTVSHNNTYVLLKNLPGMRKSGFLTYTFLLGDRYQGGLVRYLYMVLRLRQRTVWTDGFLPTFRGKIEGVLTYLRSHSETCPPRGVTRITT